MHDDRSGLPDVADDLVEREVLGLHRTGAANRGRAVLDDELFVQLEVCDRAEHAVEGSLVRADGDEDHQRAKTLPGYSALGSASANSGHCTYRRSATGRTSRPLRERPSIRVKLST